MCNMLMSLMCDKNDSVNEKLKMCVFVQPRLSMCKISFHYYYYYYYYYKRQI